MVGIGHPIGTDLGKGDGVADVIVQARRVTTGDVGPEPDLVARRQSLLNR